MHNVNLMTEVVCGAMEVALAFREPYTYDETDMFPLPDTKEGSMQIRTIGWLGVTPDVVDEVFKQEFAPPDVEMAEEEYSTFDTAEVNSDSEAGSTHGGAAEEKVDMDAPRFCEMCKFLVRVM